MILLKRLKCKNNIYYKNILANNFSFDKQILKLYKTQQLIKILSKKSPP